MGCAPPPPLWFFFFALWCRSLVVLVLGLVVSVPLSLLFRAALVGVCAFFFCVACVPVFWVSLLSVGRCPRLRVAGFGWVFPRRPFGGSCLRCRLGGGFGRLLWCWWAAWWLWAVLAPPPPVLFFFLGGSACSSFCLPWAGARTGRHSVWFFRFAVGGCVLPGRAPAPWVGWVMYTLGSAPLLAGLGSGSAGWAVVPGGFVWPWVSRVPSSLRCRLQLSGGGLCGWTATVVALCRCVAGWCRSFRVVRWLDLVRPSVSVPCLVPWCVVVRRAALCRVLTCCVVLVCAVLRCDLLGRAVFCRVAPWCAALFRVASHRAMACCAFGCLVVLRCTVVRCGAVCRAASRCAVVGRWRLGWPVSWCGVRVRAWLVGGWGVRSGGWLAGSVLRRPGCAARAGRSGRCLRGCPPWGPVPWSRVL